MTDAVSVYVFGAGDGLVKVGVAMRLSGGPGVRLKGGEP